MGYTGIKILVLGYPENRIIEFLRKEGYDVFTREKKIQLEEIEEINPAWIISYGYRHIIKPPVIKRYRNKIINLHVSYLPWNRGVSPNLWSFLENSKKGVTIHYLDEGIDTGDLLAQKEVHFDRDETLSSSYSKLKDVIEALFEETWPQIAEGLITPIKQDLTEGSYHSIADTNKVIEKLQIKDWNLSVTDLMTKKTDQEIIDDIQEIRAQNNTHWMDVVRLAFELSPVEARSIFKKIKQCDEDINNLLKKLANND